jgi:hypothetical protein
MFHRWGWAFFKLQLKTMIALKILVGVIALIGITGMSILTVLLTCDFTELDKK